MPMTTYDLVLGLPWFQTKNPDIDWGAGRLLSLRADRQLGASVSGPDILTLSATAFGDLCNSDEVAAAFCLTLGECPKGLLGATFGSHRKDGERVPRELDVRAGAAAVAAAEERKRGLNDCYWLAESMNRRKTTGTGNTCVRRTVWIWISRILELRCDCFGWKSRLTKMIYIDSGFKTMADGGHVSDSVPARSHVTDYVTIHITSGDHVIHHVTPDRSKVEYDHVTSFRRHVAPDYSRRQPGHVTISGATKVQLDDGGWISHTYQNFVDIFSKKKAKTLPPHPQTTLTISNRIPSFRTDKFIAYRKPN